MRNLFCKVVLAALLAGALGASAWAQGRIATVDLVKVRDGYWKTKQANAAIKDRAADLDKEFKGLRDELKKAGEEYQKAQTDANDQAVSVEERNKRKKVAEVKFKSYKDTEDRAVQFERDARVQLDDQQRRMRDNVITEIRTALNAKAKSAGYALVLDTSARSANSTLGVISMALNRVDPTDEMAKATPVVLFNSGENDLTDALLTQLNAAAPVETPKPPEKKTDEPKKEEKK